MSAVRAWPRLYRRADDRELRVARRIHERRGQRAARGGVRDAGGRGIGARLVAVATKAARTAGCEWLHVDFDDDLREFYLDACGFRPTNAGLIELSSPESA